MLKTDHEVKGGTLKPIEIVFATVFFILILLIASDVCIYSEFRDMREQNAALTEIIENGFDGLQNNLNQVNSGINNMSDTFGGYTWISVPDNIVTMPTLDLIFDLLMGIDGLGEGKIYDLTVVRDHNTHTPNVTVDWNYPGMSVFNIFLSVNHGWDISASISYNKEIGKWQVIDYRITP